MGKGNNRKYDSRKVIKYILSLGFERVDNERGQQRGNGDHAVYYHKDYKDLKVVIPMSGSHANLGENEMADICRPILIAMHVMDMDTSIFKSKEGIEGAFRNYAKRDVSTLFSDFVKRCLGLKDEKDVEEYIKTTKERFKKHSDGID